MNIKSEKKLLFTIISKKVVYFFRIVLNNVSKMGIFWVFALMHEENIRTCVIFTLDLKFYLINHFYNLNVLVYYIWNYLGYMLGYKDMALHL